MNPRFTIERVVMQPTTLCNLNCTYCYLPYKDISRKMSPATAQAVADSIEEIDSFIEVIWHAGEPMSSGIHHFTLLLEPFEKLRLSGKITHAIQTNATLITDEWCDLFRRFDFRIGISLDGPQQANASRINWGGKPAFSKIIQGIECLKKNKLDFSAICVIGSESIKDAQGIYTFFHELGCTSLGINFEESLGTHSVGSVQNSQEVIAFWKSLFRAWDAQPEMQLRDFARAIPSLASLGNGETRNPSAYDIFPSIAYNGDVVLLAPEFLNTKSDKYDDFVVGNISDHSLLEIAERGASKSYVRDFVAGIAKCEKMCEYFAVCFGGQAGNKFFEHGSTDVTETNFCRNSEQSLVLGLLEEVSA